MHWRVGIAVAISAAVVGGVMYGWRQHSVANLKAALSTAEQMFEERVEEPGKEGARLPKRVDELQRELTQTRTGSGVGERTVAGDLFKVYGSDREAAREEIDFYVAVPSDLPLLKKLRLLADKLSRFEFQDHPIEVSSVEERGNKKIAVVGLYEPDFPGARTWRGGYFQGSTGGHFTTLTLTKTFLQEDYEGEWVDGVEFYYEGEPISDDWDHISLSGTIYRRGGESD